MTQDLIDKINEQADKKDRMLDLIQHCTKISQGLESLPANAGDRAIWELVQNACDLANNCHIKIEVTESEFVFSHKGEPFTYETLSSLIRQVSSSKKQIREAIEGAKPTVGQYGTGFLTTHKFGKVIELKGSMDASFDDEPTRFVDLSDDMGNGFIINREFDSILDFVKMMGTQIDNAKGLLRKETQIQPSEWTEFHYKLKENNKDIALKALAQAKKLMPYVIAINPKIENVELADVTGKVIFSRLSSNDEHIDGYVVMVVEVGISEDNPQKIYCLCSEDKNQIVIIPPTKFPPLDETPSLFLYYPLLGSENFGINFIFHSASFEAEEHRDGIILPTVNENTKRKAEQNVNELREMTERLLGFLSKTSDPRFSLARQVEMARVFFPQTGLDDEYLKVFYREIREKYVSTFETLPLFETEEGNVSISSGKVEIIEPSLLEPLSEDELLEFGDVLLKYARATKVIPSYKPIEWSRIVDEWDTGKAQYFVTCEDICEKIKKKGDDLLKFIEFLNATDHQGMLNKHSLIPNRLGELCTADSLKYGATIDKDLYSVAKPLLGDKVKVLVDDLFSEVYPFGEYTRTQLRDDISTYLGLMKKETTDEGKEFADDMIDALLQYCSCYPTAGSNSFRARVMPVICSIYRKDYLEQVIPSVDSNEVDLYETPFGYLVDSIMIHIASQSPEWVKENEDTLYQFLEEYAKMMETKWKEKLTKYAVVPNQNNKLCLVAELRKNDGVDGILIDYYQRTIGEDLKDRLVNERFQDLFDYGTETAQNVATEIQNKLEADNFQDRVLIDIIERLEAGEWEGLFCSIYKQRESIRYNLGTDDEKKQINRLMRQKDAELLKELANIAEDGNAIDIIQMGKQAWENSRKDQYIKWLGAYVEHNLLRFLKQRLSVVGVDVRDEQGGQDYIISKEGYEDYRVEVKSRWSTDDSVEMSSLQAKTAVENPRRFALIMVSMHEFDTSRIEREEDMTDEEIVGLVKVADNIGVVAKDVYGAVDSLFNKDDSNVKAEGSYGFRVKQIVFKERDLGIEEFVNDVKMMFVGV